MAKLPDNKPLAILALLILLTGQVSLPGCGSDQEPDHPETGSGYDLDPPDLADLTYEGSPHGVPVLCYHYFRADFDPGYLLRVVGSVLLGLPALGPREFWTTPAREFAKHLQYFQDTGTRVMTLDEVADLLAADEPLPYRAVVLTIDDADRSVYRVAFPLLQKFGARAHLFVPTAKVGAKWSGLQVCDWGELKEMAESGLVLIESHTHDLHFKMRTDAGMQPVFLNPADIPLQIRIQDMEVLARRSRQTDGRDLPPATEDLLDGPYAPLAVDLLASRLEIAAQTGTAPRWLAWPYGFAEDDLDSLARATGFRGSVSLWPETFSEQTRLMQVGRLTLNAQSSLARIADSFGDG
jgi:peptidoglycan/xylan/chitin deacetylase (PgdA/CDA1 family)